jgi:hypothetical protein
MTESEFFNALKTVLDDGLALRSIAGVTVQQGYQPRMQGAPDGMALLLWKVNLHPYGYPKVEEVWFTPTNPPGDGYMKRTESQIYEATVQFQGSVKQPPINPNKQADVTLLPYTAGDLVKFAGRILQSVAGTEQLRALGIGTQKLAQMPQSYFKDDSDAFAQNPHFTLVLSFIDVEEIEIDFITKTGLKIVGV